VYVKARRFAAAGGVAVTERYPIAQNRPLVGPCIHAFVAAAPNQRLAQLLQAAEEWYYRQILLPDQVIVLRVDPEVAVRRKTTEPPDYVRRRARVIWDVDWSATSAHVVDAGRPLVEVVAELKTLVWAGL
jgi:thymidylate kinase